MRNLTSSIRHRVFKLIASKHIERQASSQLLPSPENSANIQRWALEREAAWIRSELRAFPLWFLGHRALAEVALRLDDVGCAYASAQALLQLRPSDGPAHLLLARCFVRRSDPKAACAILEPLVAKHANSRFGYECTKELAAALLLLGETERVVSLLGALPPRALDPETKAALAYASRRSS